MYMYVTAIYFFFFVKERLLYPELGGGGVQLKTKNVSSPFRMFCSHTAVGSISGVVGS